MQGIETSAAKVVDFQTPNTFGPRLLDQDDTIHESKLETFCSAQLTPNNNFKISLFLWTHKKNILTADQNISAEEIWL